MAENTERELPAAVVREAIRLTRLARDAVDCEERAAHERDRDEALGEHGFVARLREPDETLVLHPAEWVEDGSARLDRIEDTDRAVEAPLTDAGDEDAWERIERHNAELVAAVEREHGEVHGANARAFADFMGNHYVRRIETATGAEIEEFLAEYYPRNAWPSTAQRSAVEESLCLLFEEAGADVPGVIAARR